MELANNKNNNKHKLKIFIWQYGIILSGFFLSLIITFLLLFNFEQYFKEKSYSFYICPCMYIYLTLSFLYLISPLSIVFKKNFYKVIFNISLFAGTAWIIFFLYGGFINFYFS